MNWRVACSLLLLAGCQTSVTVPEQVEGGVDSAANPVQGADAEPPQRQDDASTETTVGAPDSIGPGDAQWAPDSAPVGDLTAPDGAADAGAPDAASADAVEDADSNSTACVPDCGGKECGDDGCGGSCGLCPTLWACDGGLCVEQECVPLCGGLECGFDGCGGVCGFCEAGELCQDGLCELECTCDGKECGDDGCGNACGTCDSPYTCVNNLCEILEGTWTCTEILGCQDLCQAEDQLCLDACVQGGDTNGQYEYQLYATCLKNHECTDKLCVADHCATETAICEYDVSGALSCAEIVNCQNECDGADQGCIDDCIPLGTIAGQAEYISLVYCIQSFCPLGSIPNCVNFALSDATLCGDYYQACLEP